MAESEVEEGEEGDAWLTGMNHTLFDDDPACVVNYRGTKRRG